MNAVGYSRVSTESQRHGHGLTRQRESIERFARDRDLTLIAHCYDVMSGAEGPERRKGLGQALALVERFNAVLLVEDRSRLARNADLDLELEERYFIQSTDPLEAEFMTRLEKRVREFLSDHNAPLD